MCLPRVPRGQQRWIESDVLKTGCVIRCCWDAPRHAPVLPAHIPILDRSEHMRPGVHSRAFGAYPTPWIYPGSGLRCRWICPASSPLADVCHPCPLTPQKTACPLPILLQPSPQSAHLPPPPRSAHRPPHAPAATRRAFQDFDAAKVDFDRAIAVNANSYHALGARGILCATQFGDMEQALRDLKDASELQPEVLCSPPSSD